MYVQMGSSATKIPENYFDPFADNDFKCVDTANTKEDLDNVINRFPPERFAFGTVDEPDGVDCMIYSKLPYMGRCGVNIETKTLQRIAELPHIIGVKEASGNILQVGDVVHHVSKKHPDFQVWAGDDSLTLPMMALGAVGVISVLSNLLPHRMVQLVEAIQNQEYIIARKTHYELLDLFKVLFIETNPIPVKAAMNFFGMPAGDVRLPLCSMTQEDLEVLQTCIEDCRRRGVL